MHARGHMTMVPDQVIKTLPDQVIERLPDQVTRRSMPDHVVFEDR